MRLLNFVVDNIVLTFMALVGLYSLFVMNRRERQQIEAKKLIKKAEKSGLNEPLSLHPEIDPGLCAGCGSCTTVCPEGDILKLVNHKAVLVSPTKCVGHGECERACPFDAIKLVFGTKTRGMEIPRLNANYETNVSGLYIAGELGGMGLIRNAIKQGILATSDAIKKLPSEKLTMT
ncbi:MAG: 4Fe-4S binding protein [Bdellovibrionaceae bacterium]|nr:4Fe-4S binding protein [Pseudobdellovibrionaceae bacterium]